MRANPGATMSAQDVASAVRGEVLLEFGGMRFVSGTRAENDSAFADAALINLRPILGDARADQRTHERARGTSGASTGDRAGNRTCDDETEAGNRNGRRRGDQRADCRSYAEACGAANACAFRSP